MGVENGSVVRIIAERRKPPGPMAITAHTTKNAICVERQRGGYIVRRSGRAAYAAPLKNAAGRLTAMREEIRAPTRFGTALPFGAPAEPSPTARR